MLEKTELVRKILLVIESGFIREAGTALTDDFTFVDPSLGRMDKGSFLRTFQAIIAAIPDFKFNETNLRAKGAAVRMSVRITGTHTARLHLPEFGVFDYPSTGVCIELTEEPAEVTVRNHWIAGMEFGSVPGGGLGGLLENIGIRLPSPLRPRR